jgi:protein-disulfide isomerase
MKLNRKLIASLIAAPLMLSACGETETAGGVASGEPITPIAAPVGTSWTETVTVTPEGGYMIGNPAAPLKLVEYASHTCGACANFAVNGKPALKDQYVASGVVSFEQREVFLNPYDVVIATITQCGTKEQMQPLSDEVWRNLEEVFAGLQGNPEAIQAASELPLEQRFIRIAEVSGMLDFFAARGISADQARSCLADRGRIESMVERAEAQSRESNVTGTPTFLLNGRKIEANQWPQLEPILQRAGAR